MFGLLVFGVLLKFSWQVPTTGAPPQGYRVLIGTTPGNYTQTIDVGNVLTKDIDVNVDTVKYVSVEAYNQYGTSGPSQEVVLGKP